MEILQQLRNKRKVTQQQLADVLNIPRSTLAHYESGRNEMSYDLLSRTADYFEVSVDYLLGRERQLLFDDARYAQPEIFKVYSELTEEERKNLLNFARGMIAIRNKQ